MGLLSAVGDKIYFLNILAKSVRLVPVLTSTVITTSTGVLKVCGFFAKPSKVKKIFINLSSGNDHEDAHF